VIFLNTQMDLFILKTDVEKFTSPYKKTLHLIFNTTLSIDSVCICSHESPNSNRKSQHGGM